MILLIENSPSKGFSMWRLISGGLKQAKIYNCMSIGLNDKKNKYYIL